MTTLELDRRAEELIRAAGGEPSFLGYMGYPASICASVDEVVIHGIPDQTRLKEGEILSIDIGIDLDGYFSDRALTVPVGKISDEKSPSNAGYSGMPGAGD